MVDMSGASLGRKFGGTGTGAVGTGSIGSGGGRASNGGGGGSSGGQTPFQQLAARRGVDIQKEQERAKAERAAGQQIGSTQTGVGVVSARQPSFVTKTLEDSTVTKQAAPTRELPAFVSQKTDVSRFQGLQSLRDDPYGRKGVEAREIFGGPKAVDMSVSPEIASQTEAAFRRRTIASAAGLSSRVEKFKPKQEKFEADLQKFEEGILKKQESGLDITEADVKEQQRLESERIKLESERVPLSAGISRLGRVAADVETAEVDVAKAKFDLKDFTETKTTFAPSIPGSTSVPTDVTTLKPETQLMGFGLGGFVDKGRAKAIAEDKRAREKLSKVLGEESTIKPTPKIKITPIDVTKLRPPTVDTGRAAELSRGTITFENIDEASKLSGALIAKEALTKGTTKLPGEVLAKRKVSSELTTKVQSFEDIQTSKTMGIVLATGVGVGAGAGLIGLAAASKVPVVAKVGSILSSKAVGVGLSTLFVGGQVQQVKTGIAEIDSGLKTKGQRRIINVGAALIGTGTGVAAVRAPTTTKAISSKAQTVRVSTKKGILDVTKAEQGILIERPLFQRVFGKEISVHRTGGLLPKTEKLTFVGKRIVTSTPTGKPGTFRTKGTSRFELIGKDVKIVTTEGGAIVPKGDISKALTTVNVKKIVGGKLVGKDIFTTATASKVVKKGTTLAISERVKVPSRDVLKGISDFKPLKTTDVSVSVSKEIASITDGLSTKQIFKTEGLGISNKAEIKRFQDLFKLTPPKGGTKGRVPKATKGKTVTSTLTETGGKKGGAKQVLEQLQKVEQKAGLGAPSPTTGKTILKGLNIGQFQAPTLTFPTTRIKQEQALGLGVKPIGATKFTQISQALTGTGVKPIQQLGLGTLSVSALKTDQLVIPKLDVRGLTPTPTTPLIPPLTFPTYTPPKIPPTGFPLPFFPGGGGGAGRAPRRKKKTKRTLRFQPSLIAADIKIFGKKPKTLTGLEIRPILS